MNHKIKDMGRRILSLVLAFIMIMPTGAFAGTHSVSSWDEFREKLKDDISKQEESIVIEYTGDEVFTPSSVLVKAKDMFEEAKIGLPKYLTELNIETVDVTFEFNDTEKGTLKKIIYDIKYYILKNDVQKINNILKKSLIGDNTADYGKIEAVYDYIVDQLKESNGEFSDIDSLNKDDVHPHAFLFSMIMDKLGYDNDIAIGKGDKQGKKWNLVKVQGLWYHVDGASEISIGDKWTQFLISKDDDEDWNKDDHKDKAFATINYDANSPTMPQLKYEISLIEKEIEKFAGEISNTISKAPDTSSMEKFKEIKKAIEDMESKIANYEERIDIIEDAIGHTNDLKASIEKLKASIEKEKDKVNEFKIDVIKKTIERAEKTLIIDDILIAIEAAEMKIDKASANKMRKLKIAVEAIEKAEATKLEKDIELAKAAIESYGEGQAKQPLEKKIEGLKATIAVKEAMEELENILEKYLNDFPNGNKGQLDAAIGNFNTKIEELDKNTDIDTSHYKERLKVARDTRDAIDAIKTVNVDEGYEQYDVKVSNAKEAIIKVTDSKIKEKLTKILEDITSEIDKERIEAEAIELVDNAEENMKDILGGTDGADTEIKLNEAKIEETESKLKEAKTAVKKIKDKDIKANQNARIKDIETAMAAIKAVVKAGTKPLKMTNITSARKSVDKIKDDENPDKISYSEIKVRLNKILENLEAKILVQDIISKAEKAVEKAEKSMKELDIASAKQAVKLLEGTSESTKTEGLNKRISMIEKMNTLEDRLTEYLNQDLAGDEELLKKLLLDLNNAIGDVSNNIDDIDGVGEAVKEKYENRLSVARQARAAMEAIKNVINVMSSSQDENEIKNKIKDAEKTISSLTDAKIKKDLESKLNNIIANRDLEAKIKKAKDAVDVAKKSVKEKYKSEDSLNLIEDAVKAVNLLTSGKDKTGFQNIIKELNNVIKAKQLVENAEEKLANGNLVLKDVTAAKKAVDALNKEYREAEPEDEDGVSLVERVKYLEDKVLTETNEAKATALVEKAIASKKETDIKAAIDAVSKLNPGDKKDELNKKIEDKIIVALKDDADIAVKATISSIQRDDKSVSKNITETKKSILLFINIIDFIGNTDLKADGAINYKDKYKSDIGRLNTNIELLDISNDALKAVQQAEKTKAQSDVDLADKVIGRMDLEDKYASIEDLYKEMKLSLISRLDFIKDHLKDEGETEAAAETAISKAEDILNKNYTEPDNENNSENPSTEDLRKVQEAINKVNDKTKKANFQKRLDAINAAITAKAAVERAEAYTDVAGVKAAEKALNDLAKTNSYLNIVTNLGNRVAVLNNKLNISKKIDEATKLVQKAMDSRKETDIEKARAELVSLELAINSFEEGDYKEGLKAIHKNLEDLLEKLGDSIDNEAGNQDAISKEARDALYGKEEEAASDDDKLGAFGIIDKVNKAVMEIVEGQEGEAEAIQSAYRELEKAKSYVRIATTAARRLGNPKDLADQISHANAEIDLSEDNIDVKEAVRLVTIASDSVNKVQGDKDKSKAKLDIAAARRAIDKINHNNNKAIKTTILNTINAIEKKLTSDNDEEFIDAAVLAVNKVADMLTNAVVKDTIKDKETQTALDQAIFSAELAIGWISDNNKVAKNILTGFLNEIKAMYEAEKAGIQNEERIRLAEEAVERAEQYAESNKDDTTGIDSYIRSARLRIRMIINNSPETELKITELNDRLDRLEGKYGSGGSGSNGSGGSGSGGNGSGGSGGGSGSNKPGGNTSGGNKVPTRPKPSGDRDIGVTDPKWGDTIELENKNPIIKLPR